MTKTYCDKCEAEITKANEIRNATINMGSGHYELAVTPIIHIIDSERRRHAPVPGVHHVCMPCVVEAFNRIVTK